MKKNYESGHGKNISNFEDMLSLIPTYGSKYDPARPELKFVALKTLLVDATTAKTNFDSAKTNYTVAVTDREQGFLGLRKLCSDTLKYAKLLGLNAGVIEDLNSLNRRIQGTRAIKLSAAALADPDLKSHSVSHLSYDSLMDSFSDYVRLLQTIPTYAPNEPQYQIANLLAYHARLVSLSNAVADAFAVVTTARGARNEILYLAPVNLYRTALDVQNYISLIFGSKSTDYKVAKSFKFRKDSKIRK